jgi:hypothetical protein
MTVDAAAEGPQRFRPGGGNGTDCRTPRPPTGRRSQTPDRTPEGADGQSGDGSGSLQLPLLFLKRRLRAAASRPSSPPSTGHTGSPQPTARRSMAPPCPLSRLPSQHGRRRGGEGWRWIPVVRVRGIGLALRAPRLGPCTQTRTGRSSLAGRDAHGPSAVEGRKKVRALH